MQVMYPGVFGDPPRCNIPLLFVIVNFGLLGLLPGIASSPAGLGTFDAAKARLPARQVPKTACRQNGPFHLVWLLVYIVAVLEGRLYHGPAVPVLPLE